ncbi:MAG: alpha-galactosidase [Lentisphaeria bacterium]
MNDIIYDEIKRRLSLSGRFTLLTERIGWGDQLHLGESIGGQPLRIGDVFFAEGLGDNAQSRHVVSLPSQGKTFEAWVGLQAGCHISKVVFVVEAGGREIYRSRILEGKEPPEHLQAELQGATRFIIRALYPEFSEDSTDTPPMCNANWCNPQVTLTDGHCLMLTEANRKTIGTNFLYDGLPFDAVPENELLSDDDEMTVFRQTRRSADGLLLEEIIIKLYKRFPIVEWQPWLHNFGEAPSGLVSNYQSLSLHERVHKITIRRTLGSKCDSEDFVTESMVMRKRSYSGPMVLRADEGRSSASWLPFLGLDFTATEGVNVAIGWSGAWKAELSLENALLVQAGLLKTNFRVLPMERLRQASIILHFRHDLSIEDGQNEFRRFMMHHHSPRNARGELFPTPVSFMTWGGLTSQVMLDRIALIRKQKLPHDVFWMDAGWFGQDGDNIDVFVGPWYQEVGNWRMNRNPHPDGLGAVSRAARAAGLKSLLWVEIERAVQGTPTTIAHPEWFLTAPGSNNALLNLGHEKAWQYAVDTICCILKDNEIDYYRQDFNVDPLPFWSATDAPDRLGISEMKHIDGLYRFFDELRRYFPDIYIDNCASGGRRIDFELLSRSCPLWRSDVQCIPNFDCTMNQIENFYLTSWVPFHAGGVWGKPLDDYDFFSGLASGLSTHFFESIHLTPDPDYPMDWYRSRIAHACRVRPYYTGNYYQLTSTPEDKGNWCAYQLALEEDGIFLAFRRPESLDSSLRLALRQIQIDGNYELEDKDGNRNVISGQELLKLCLDFAPRECGLFYYTRLDKSAKD